MAFASTTYGYTVIPNTVNPNIAGFEFRDEVQNERARAQVTL